MNRRTQVLAVFTALNLLVFSTPAWAGGGGGAKNRTNVRVLNNSSTATAQPLEGEFYETVPVGDAGNASVTLNGVAQGAVADAFRIGKY